MINQKVREYIESKSFCSEYLFKDWNTFLDLLYAEGGHVSAILWWDHCRVDEQHLSVGLGGYSDPENEEYMFAETQEYVDCLENKTLDDIKTYIIETISTGISYNGKYHSFDLVPSFYICD
ncbi:MAG: hypothetical protein NC084_08365 [Bacteroides sp.]|nr:hypothetical protein [Eubacterium sp.]MCM1418656.1 hypothetical protein [Roseburia sp.]MCM1462710.1 hypothetical protein [Bacteroides sp.]